MSHPDVHSSAANSPLRAASGAAGASRGATRVDAAHVVASSGGPDDRSAARGESISAEIRAQLTQLASNLQSRQSELDRREAALNARQAELENEIRRARIWLDGRCEAMDQREAELGQLPGDGARTNERLDRVVSAERRRAPAPQAAQDHPSTEKAASTATAPDTAAAGAGDSASDPWKQRQRALLDQVESLQRELRESEAARSRLAETNAKRDSAGAATDGAVHQERQLKAQLQTLRQQQESRERQHEYQVQRIEQRAAESEKTSEKLAAEVEALRAERARRDAESAHRSDQVDLRTKSAKDKLVQARRKLNQQRDALADDQRRWQQRCENVIARERALAQRAQQLDQFDALLAEQQSELESARRDWESARAAAERRFEADRDEWASRMAREREEQKRAKLALAGQRESLESRQAALENLQAEVRDAQREALELRLATEELWVQLSGAMAPAVLTQSIAGIRRQLADHFRHADEQLAAQKKEIAELTGRLEQQHRKIRLDREETGAWIERRRAEIEEQAARLVSREQQLDRQESIHERRSRAWDEQRHGYQRRIRELLDQLRAADSVAVG